MNIRKAEERDISRITEIYAHARAFMAENGNATQWSGGYPGEDVIRADIAAGTLHVCEREGKVAAVFAFILGGDPCYAVIDGAWHAARPYGTIHRIASDGTAKGMARFVFDWCAQQDPTASCASTRTRTTGRCRRLSCATVFSRAASYRVRGGARLAFDEVRA